MSNKNLLKLLEEMEYHFREGLQRCCKAKRALSGGVHSPAARKGKKKGLSEEQKKALVINLRRSFNKKAQAL